MPTPEAGDKGSDAKGERVLADEPDDADAGTSESGREDKGERVNILTDLPEGGLATLMGVRHEKNKDFRIDARRRVAKKGDEGEDEDEPEKTAPAKAAPEKKAAKEPDPDDEDDDLDSLRHKNRTLRGMFKSQRDRHTALEAANRQLTAKLAELTRGQLKGAPAAPASDKKKDKDDEGFILDEKADRFLGDLLEKKRTEDAIAFLTTEFDKALKTRVKEIETRVESRLKEHDDRARSAEEEEALDALASSSFKTMATIPTDQGEPAFPLLALDEDGRPLHSSHYDKILKVWGTLQSGDPRAPDDYPPLDPEFAATPAGVFFAYTVYVYDRVRDVLPELLGMRKAPKRKAGLTKAKGGDDDGNRVRRRAAIFDRETPVRAHPDDEDRDDGRGSASSRETKQLKSLFRGLRRHEGII